MTLDPKTRPENSSVESTQADRAKLEQQIATLETRLSDLKSRFPAHSTPPGMIAELDELDEQLAAARARLSANAKVL